MVEQRTAQVGCKASASLLVNQCIADNPFGKALCRLDRTPLAACLHRLLKAEHRRGNLAARQPHLCLARGNLGIDSLAHRRYTANSAGPWHFLLD
jgi:hypothetical protein